MSTATKRADRLALIAAHLARHPGDATRPMSDTWRACQTVGYDATQRTFARDFAELQVRIVSNLTGRMVAALLLIDSEIARTLDHPDRPPESVVALLREQRATLRYDERPPVTDDPDHTPGRRNKYTEEKYSWRSARPETADSPPTN